MIINKQYIIRINISGKDLVYTAIIISEDDKFISFKDKYGKTFWYNKNFVVSCEEVII